MGAVAVIDGLQANETMTLMASIALAPFVFASVRNLQHRVRAYMLGAYAAALLGEICTNAESFVLPGLLNLAEHASWAVAAVLFAHAVHAIRRYGIEGSVRG